MDNTRVACGCADGQVVMAEVAGRTLADRHLSVTLTSSESLQITDSAANLTERIGGCGGGEGPTLPSSLTLPSLPKTSATGQ